MKDSEKLDLLLKEISGIKSDVSDIKQTLKVIDKRLSLIENRLTNIEPFISVDNKHLQYQAA